MTTPAFVPKPWQDEPSQATPINAAALIDLETRVTDFALEVVQGPPAATVLPALAGAAIVAQTIVVNQGTWSGSPTTFSYQWFRGGNTVPGATQTTYVVTSADVGSSLSCQVTATGPTGTGVASTPSTAPVVTASVTVPQNLTVPTVAGSATQGATLTATQGTWSNSPTSFAYQWRSSGTNIAGATSSTYVVQASDVGNTVSVTVIASNTGGPSLPASSATVGPIVASAAPANTVTPTIGGTMAQGSVLTVSNGTWSASPAITGYTYQWYRVPTSSGAPTVVQSLSGTGNASASPVTKAFGVNVTNGNTIILMATCKSGSGGMSVSSVTKSAGTATISAFTQRAALTGFAGTLDGEIWSATVTGTGSLTLSAAMAGTLQATAEAIAVMEVSGLSSFDSAATASGSGTVASVTCGTPATSGEWMFACAFLSAAATASPTSGQPWTTSTGPASFNTSNINPAAWGQLSGTSPLTASWTQGATSSYWEAMCAIFQTVAGSATLLAGATNQTYTAVVGDVNSTLLCAVTATNAAGSTTVNSLATPTITATATSTAISQLVDTFPGTGLAAQWTTVQGVKTVANNALTVSDLGTPTIIASTSTYSLQNSTIFAQVTPDTSSGVYTALACSLDQNTGVNNAIEIHTIGSTIYGTLIQATVSVDFASTAFNASTMLYWRVREQSGTLYAEYSANGTTWTLLGSTTYSIAVTAMYAQLVGGTNSTTGKSSTFAQINQVTQPPTPPGGGTTFVPAGPYTTSVFFDDFAGTSLDATSWHATDTASGDPNGGQPAFGITSQLKSSVAVGSFTPPGGTSTSCLRLTAPSSSGGANVTTLNTGYWEPGATPLKSWDHGTFVARMWMPPGQGMWPAFWLLTTTGYVSSGGVGAEIDACEMIMGPQTDTHLGFFDFNSREVWQTVHLPGTQNGNSQGYNLGYDASGAWTTFGVSFSVPTSGQTGTITFYVNNVQTHQLTGFTWPPSGNQQWFILLDLVSYNNPTNTYPQYAYVDWVGVWQ